MPGKEIVFVLGYARSGTSALTRIISLCGFAVPETVFGATELNPTGHWEPVVATNLNLEFLSSFHAVDDPRMSLMDVEISSERREDYIRRIQDFLCECPEGPLVIKEFRINELLEFWLEAASREGYTVKVVIALRCPQEVVCSISAGHRLLNSGSAIADVPSQLSTETTNAFWLKTNLLAERHSRSLPRVIVGYGNLIKDWRFEIDRISTILAIDLRVNKPAIDAFLTEGLYRQRSSVAVTETFCYSWMTRVYDTLSTASRDAPLDTNTLDEIYDAYSMAARTFGHIWSNFCGRQKQEHLQKFVDSLPIWRAGQDF